MGFTAGQLINILVLNLVLSGDNALLIALSANGLASKKERNKAMLYGSLGAVVLLICMAMCAQLLMKIPYVTVAGGLLLFKIALDLTKEPEHADVKEANSLAHAVRQIIIANVIMSVDNSFALAGASGGNAALMVVGIVGGSIVVFFGGTLIAWAMRKVKILVFLGAAILAHTGADMICGEQALNRHIPLEGYSTWISLAAGVAVFLFALIKHLVSLRREKKFVVQSVTKPS